MIGISGVCIKARTEFWTVGCTIDEIFICLEAQMLRKDILRTEFMLCSRF